MLVRFIIYGILGIAALVAVTGLKAAVTKRDFTFPGEAPLILFPVFGCTAFLYPLVAQQISGWEWYLRGLVLMAAFYIAQALAGWLLGKASVCPWRYGGSLSIGGLVRLADAPLFFLAGLLLEWLDPIVRAAATAIAI